MAEKIVVVAGNRDQFKRWLRDNIIPVLCKRDVELLGGCLAKEIHYVGTYEEWMDDNYEAMVKSRKVT